MIQINIIKNAIPGSFLIIPFTHDDVRGRFVKTFNTENFSLQGLSIDFKEDFYSISKKNVLRGLHFQVPPCDHAKVVYCVQGAIFDVIVDLRIGSPTYQKFQLFELNSVNANMVFIPTGVAHGFYTLSDVATVMYKVTSLHSAEHDSGIRWNSAGIPWPNDFPILSDRDMKLPRLSELSSPFVYDGLKGGNTP